MQAEASSRHPALPKGLPLLKVDSTARPASAFKLITVLSNQCPIIKRGREVSPTSPSIK